MTTKTLSLAAIWILLLPPSMPGQLFVISGAPTPNDIRKYAITLAQIGAGGSVASTEELFPQTVGAEWIGVSYDHRRALIFAGDENSAIVLDLDTAKVAKKCVLPTVKGAYLITQYMVDVPDNGLTFAWFLKGQPSVGDHVFGMILNPEVSCEASIGSVPHSDVILVAASGTAGVADIRSPEGVGAAVQGDGTLIPAVFADDQTPWDDKVPVRFTGGLPNPPTPTSVVINNSTTMVIHIATGKNNKPLYLALRKRDKTWHVIQARTDEWDRMRGFAKFIAITEARPKTESERIVANKIDMTALLQMEADQKMSPGVKEWRTELQPDSFGEAKKSVHGPDMVESFELARDIYPGRLLLFDIESDKSYSIETKQGDSEILLVENGTVYYRVSNRIYSAPILASTIGPPKLIVKDEIIRDVHYAFFKR